MSNQDKEIKELKNIIEEQNKVIEFKICLYRSK